MSTVLSVAYPLAPVGPDAVGGAEQVLAALDRALVAAGHRSIVVAREDSTIAGHLVPTARLRGPFDAAATERAQATHRMAIEKALQRWPIDLIHLHGIDFWAYLPRSGPPALVTLHLPLAWYPDRALRPERPNTFLHAVSRAQRRLGPADLPLLPDVPNGVALHDLPPKRGKRPYALFLGRICPEKGLHLAIAAAKLARSPLLIGGAVYPYAEHEAYFASVIEPELDGRRRFLGALPFARKRRLLRNASCLLVPSLCPETSSLVAMEALSCGTPVVAFAAGALPEIVEHGRTGFIVEGVGGMAEAIRACRGLDPDACRQAAEARFSQAAMVERYLALHRLVLRRSTPGGHAVVA